MGEGHGGDTELVESIAVTAVRVARRDDGDVIPGCAQHIRDALNDGTDPVHLGRVGVCHQPNPHAPTIGDEGQGPATAG